MFDSLLKYSLKIGGDLRTVEFLKDLRGVKSKDGETSEETDKLVRETEILRAQAFDDEFYGVLKSVVKIHFGGAGAKVGLILPDSAFFTDTFKVPLIKGKTESAVGVAIDALYKNADELEVRTFPLSQNRQTATFGALGIKRETLKKLRSALEEDGVSVPEITSEASATVACVSALNPKLRNANYMLIDVKADATKYIYVNGGIAVGSLSLPFGTKVLSKDYINQENSLFNHRSAESVVVKAQEKAKKNRVLSDAETGNALAGKRRKAPKILSRERPQTEEGFVYENFRPTIKYALEILSGNPELSPSEPLKNVYLNIPEEYGFLFDMIRSENLSLSFEPLALSEEVKADLALYGGFYLKKYNKLTDF